MRDSDEDQRTGRRAALLRSHYRRCIRNKARARGVYNKGEVAKMESHLHSKQKPQSWVVSIANSHRDGRGFVLWSKGVFNLSVFGKKKVSKASADGDCESLFHSHQLASYYFTTS